MEESNFFPNKRPAVIISSAENQTLNLCVKEDVPVSKGFQSSFKYFILFLRLRLRGRKNEPAVLQSFAIMDSEPYIVRGTVPASGVNPSRNAILSQKLLIVYSKPCHFTSL